MQGHLSYDMVGVGGCARSFEGLEGVHHNIDDSGPKALIADQLPLNQQLISEYCSGVFPYLWNRAFSYGYGLWIEGLQQPLCGDEKHQQQSLCGDEKHQWEIRLLYKRVESRLGEGCE